MKPRLTVAIPTWNNFRVLEHCLRTLTTYTEYPYKIVVVNNGPASDLDGLPFERTLRERVPFGDLKVIQADSNLGWQGGINRAFVEECDTPYFCMANDDLAFIPYQRGFWKELAHWFEYPEVGAVGPASNYVMGSQSIFDMRGMLAFESTLLIGFCMVVRSELFSQIGGLDEGLPGGDDLDLSILIRKAGYKLIVDKAAYVHHIGSVTGPRVEKPGFWNSSEHQDMTNNAIIRKHGVRAWYETIQSRIASFAPATVTDDSEGDKIREWVGDLETGLDVGCGANKTVPTAVAVDRDPCGMAGVAGGRKFDASVADIAADAASIPVESGSQDYVIARHLVEHLLDPFAALAEWRRVLRHGGVLVVALPNHDVYDTMAIDYTHLHAYNPITTEKLLRACGFEIEETEVMRVGMSFVTKARKPSVVLKWKPIPIGASSDQEAYYV